MVPNVRQRTSKGLSQGLVESFVILSLLWLTASPVAAAGKPFQHRGIHQAFRRVTWTPTAVSTTIAPGETQTLSVSLSSSRTLRNVGVQVARKLKPFVHVDPPAFERIGKGHTVNINVSMSVPESAVSGRVKGKIRLVRRLGFGWKGKTIAIPLILVRPLPVVIDIQPTPLAVTITEPADGTTVATESLLVSGTVDAAGTEVGVTVNDFPAAVYGNTFAALVPVTPETTTVTAVATTAAEGTASHSVAINVSAPSIPPARLSVSPPAGVAPLTVAFSLASGPVPTTIDLDLVGDGTLDLSGPSLVAQTFTYTQPGLFFPTVTLTDVDGNQHTASAVVQVYDQAALDSLLEAKWTGMKDALRAGDIPGALSHIALRSRSRYEALFEALSATLGSIDTILTDLTLDEVGDQEAFYEMVRNDTGVTKSFEIRFSVDEDGIWRLRMF